MVFCRYLTLALVAALLLSPLATAQTPPAETKPAETKPADAKPEEKKPEDQKPEEKKPEEKKPDEKKPDDKPAESATTPAGPLPGHSHHGEVFDEGPRQKAYLMEGMPKIHFAVTTKTPEAQKFIEQGVGQIHGFWYYEAERSFRQAATLDKDCAIAYWGMAMSNIDNAKRAKKFMAECVKHKSGSASARRCTSTRPTPTSRPTTASGRSATKPTPRPWSGSSTSIPDDIEARALPGPATLEEPRRRHADRQLPGDRRPARPGLQGRPDAPGPPLPHSPVGHREGRERAGLGRPVRADRRRASPTCGTCRGTSIRGPSGMRTPAGSRKLRPASIMPT